MDTTSVHGDVPRTKAGTCSCLQVPCSKMKVHMLEEGLRPGHQCQTWGCAQTGAGTSSCLQTPRSKLLKVHMLKEGQ